MKKVSLTLMAEYVILYCQNTGVNITPLKLQKLLYYLDCWHIAKFNKATLFDELPEAWASGPVYRQVYDMFKTDFFKNDTIKVEIGELELSEKFIACSKTLDISEVQAKLINDVLAAYCVFTDEQLVFMTHRENPWNEARQGLSPIERTTNKLSADTIYTYFNSQRT